MRKIIGVPLIGFGLFLLLGVAATAKRGQVGGYVVLALFAASLVGAGIWLVLAKPGGRRRDDRGRRRDEPLDTADLLDMFEDDLPDIRRGQPGETFALDRRRGEIVVAGRLRGDDREAAEEFADRANRYVWKYSIAGIDGPDSLDGRPINSWLVNQLWLRASRFAEKQRYKVEGRKPGPLTRLKWWFTDAGPS